ncbi:type VII toxin-antitoxin system MntA family adenylyltransferase antitoxin [Domibacillus enclensis]|uniref:Nucleotidyltransferase domain-containing protein n=1 Tax=Domibacillus enclensis TaxID=1017273 RepID=A0A1N7AFF9_9BACI|nr:nucleotidyltransferase domain-containing protein [Domibacillus enclensis]SIR37796.1 Nucleotidyltransferase domain-containing protein [Domibacillus enclensis]
MFVLAEETKTSLIATIVQTVDPAFIILFGSFAKERNRPESDLDLAYFSEKALSSYERFELAGELAIITGREVDLVDLKKADTIFTMQIFSQGEPIYVKNQEVWTQQKMRAYSMYATLNEQRKPVLDAIKKRGSVFGHE